MQGLWRRRDESIHEKVLAHKEITKDIEQVGQEVRYDGDKQHEFGELMRPPGPLEVATAIQDSQAGGDEAEEVLLDNSCKGECPGIPRHREAGHNGQPWHSVTHADDGLLDLFHPIGVGTQAKVEQGEQDEGSEDATGKGREINAGHGGGSSCSGGGALSRGSSVGVVVRM